MSERVVVDPITRIEGHLRIEAETDADNVITRASCAGTMLRGIEIVMRALGVGRCMIGVEDNKLDAVAAIDKRLPADGRDTGVEGKIRGDLPESLEILRLAVPDADFHGTRLRAGKR